MAAYLFVTQEWDTNRVPTHSQSAGDSEPKPALSVEGTPLLHSNLSAPHSLHGSLYICLPINVWLYTPRPRGTAVDLRAK